jgi:hypothetical protein
METLPRRVFPSVQQAINDLRKEGTASVLICGTLGARKTIRSRNASSGEWIIFDKGRGRCEVLMARREQPVPIRLSLRSAVAIYIPSGSYSLSTDTTIAHKVLSVF